MAVLPIQYSIFDYFFSLTSAQLVTLELSKHASDIFTFYARNSAFLQIATCGRNINKSYEAVTQNQSQ